MKVLQARNQPGPALERVHDLYAAALERNRDEFEAMARRLHRGASKRQRVANRPIALQPFGTVSLRAVCGVANPRNSGAIAAVSRLASHPAKPSVAARGDRQHVLKHRAAICTTVASVSRSRFAWADKKSSGGCLTSGTIAVSA